MTNGTKVPRARRATRPTSQIRVPTEDRTVERGRRELYAIVERAVAEQPPLEDVIWAVTHRAALLALETVDATNPNFAVEIAERLSWVEGAVPGVLAALENAADRPRIVPSDLARAVRVAIYATAFTAYAGAIAGALTDRDAFAREIADMVTRYLLARTRRDVEPPPRTA